jgi:hypothetical protein
MQMQKQMQMQMQKQMQMQMQKQMQMQGLHWAPFPCRAIGWCQSLAQTGRWIAQ